jgi:AhpD family alkylhydroperoxidase
MRYDYPSIAPLLVADLRKVTVQVYAGPVEKSILSLVELRVSQINGCAFCIDRHAREAHQAGVPLGMIIGLSAWRDDRRFVGTLRAALALVEALTDPAHRSERDAAYDALDGLVSEAEIVHLTIAIGLAGAWNRIASGCQRHVGDAPWPHDGGRQTLRQAKVQTQPVPNVAP